jgi:hypothetical protein
VTVHFVFEDGVAEVGDVDVSHQDFQSSP